MKVKVFDINASEHRAELSYIQKYVLLRFHPRKIFIDVVGAIWATYYLWLNDWQRAVGFILVFSVASLLSVCTVDPNKMAETALGRIGLLHLHPINFSVQILGMIPTVYGVWQHHLEMTLIGLSIVLIGHSYGWGHVDKRFSSKRLDKV